MTFKFPLINLIARGHLPLSNKVASLNFAKSLDDGPATKICYEMMKFDNPKESALYLESVQRAFINESQSKKAVITEDYDFRHQRDLVLFREDKDETESVVIDPYTRVRKIMLTSGMGAALAWYATRPKNEQNQILASLKRTNSQAYDLFANNWAGQVMHLPADGGKKVSRLAKTVLGVKNKHTGSRNWMTPSETEGIKKFGKSVLKKGGIALAIATSVTAAIVLISSIYKKFFSYEAKQCNKYGGKDRTVCLTKARIKACDAAIEKSKEALLDCSSAKNEEDCIFKMKVEIRSWTKKKAAEEEKLRKLTNVNSDAFGENKPKSNDPFQ